MELLQKWCKQFGMGVVGVSEDLRVEVFLSHQTPGPPADANGIESCYVALRKLRSSVVSLSKDEDVCSLGKLYASVAETFATCTEATLKLLQPLLSLNRPSLLSPNSGTIKPSYSQALNGVTNETPVVDVLTCPSRQAPTDYWKVKQDAKRSAISKLVVDNPIQDYKSRHLIVNYENHVIRGVLATLTLSVS